MYRPKDRDKLEQLIVDCYHGKLYLKDIDVSLITDMLYMFNPIYYRRRHDEHMDINEIWEDERNDIKQWDLSGVTNMINMFAYSKFNRNLSIWVLSLDHNVDTYLFNERSKHSDRYGAINSYEDFVKTVTWDVVKNRIHDIMEYGSDSDKYKLLKKLNSVKQFSNIDIGNITL